MLRLRKILLCKYLYYGIAIGSILLTVIRISFPIPNFYKEGQFHDEVKLLESSFDGNQWTLILKGKEKLKATFYFEEEKQLLEAKKNYHLGDILFVEGILIRPPQNTVPNTFNYREYLKGERIFHLLEITDLSLRRSNRNIFYKVKEEFQRTVSKRKLAPYYQTFLLGDTALLENKVKKSYQENGISHLFAISGMHISLLSGFFLKGLKFLHCNEKSRYSITLVFLYFFLFLTGGSASILRSVIFFTLLAINRIYYFYVPPLYLFALTFSAVILYSPFILFQVGFQFSFLISFFLLLSQEYLKDLSKKKVAFFVSFLSFLVSFPVSIYQFYQVNILSIFYNLFYVPFVSCFLFPSVLLSFFFPFLEIVSEIGVFVLEESSLLLGKISLLKISYPKPSLFFCFFLLILLVVYLKVNGKMRKRALHIFLILSVLIKFYPLLSKDSYLIVLDIGQGDSIFIKSNLETVLVDTGGKMKFQMDAWKKKRNTTTIFEQRLLPFFKSLGISKLNALVLTHGDEDHLGEAKELIENILVETVYFNLGEYNSNEKKIIEILKKKNIRYESMKTGESYQIGSISLQSLNKGFGDENDASTVIYGIVNGFRFLLTGDASIQTEKWLLDEYSMEKIDILKLGHHGSRTSTSSEFLNVLQPEVALISAGKDNKFNHPHKEVLNLLKEKSIAYYLTSEVGSIKITFTKGGTITCYPP